MDANNSATQYLTLKEFLARNSCVNPRTFSRWKKQGTIDYLQPGGPNTQILVPADALQRMEVRRRSLEQSNSVGDELSQPNGEPKGVRQPSWKKNLHKN